MYLPPAAPGSTAVVAITFQGRSRLFASWGECMTPRPGRLYVDFFIQPGGCSVLMLVKPHPGPCLVPALLPTTERDAPSVRQCSSCSYQKYILGLTNAVCCHFPVVFPLACQLAWHTSMKSMSQKNGPYFIPGTCIYSGGCIRM